MGMDWLEDIGNFTLEVIKFIGAGLIASFYKKRKENKRFKEEQEELKPIQEDINKIATELRQGKWNHKLRIE